MVTAIESRHPTVRETTALARARARLLAVTLGLIVTGVFGYLGFSVVASGGVSAGVIGLGAATGFAAFFSPCSFPLMLTFLARRSEESMSQAVASGARVALGATVLLTILTGAVIASGGAIASIIEFDRPLGRVFRAVIGLFLVIMGARQAHLIRMRIGAFDRLATVAAAVFDPTRSRHRWTGDLVYGFGYLLAGFG